MQLHSDGGTAHGTAGIISEESIIDNMDVDGHTQEECPPERMTWSRALRDANIEGTSRKIHAVRKTEPKQSEAGRKSEQTASQMPGKNVLQEDDLYGARANVCPAV